MCNDEFLLHVMRVDLHINVTLSLNMGLKSYAKSIDPGQPAQTAQADLVRKFLLLVISMHITNDYTI